MEPPDQAATIRFLSRPSAYPHHHGAVRRIDTHGAVVFLVGARVYKLKRAVRLPYMDFSTPAKRFAVCRAEIALNRRTAPELYLGLAAVLERDSGLVLGRVREPPVPASERQRARDWVVVMKRFPADALYDRIATRGRLDAEEAEAIAEVVARFHAACPPVRAPSRSRSLRWVVDGNTAALAARAPGLFAPSDVRTLARLSDASLARVSRLLAERRRQGYVRHLHGDLHLRNICRLDGRPVLFDALEFDPRLATTDVLYDLAFLLMDMEHRGLRDAANRLFNHYLALTVDPKRAAELKSLAALPLFLSARAAVRAHTEAAAADTQSRAVTSAAHRANARSYLRLAGRLLKPPKPVLIAIGGLSGSGKTTLARALAPQLGAAPGALVLRSDVLRKRLAGVDPLVRLPPSAYGPELTGAVYQVICRAATTALAAGHAVIADAVFAREDERRAIARAAGRLGIPFVGVWLDAPPAVMTTRLDARRNDASDATRSVLQQQLGYDLGSMTWTRIDAAEGTAAVAARTHRMLEAWLSMKRMGARTSV
jgi:aminoglycoside phosphotransferase family enzyme/predicted kinase